eukprot:7994744-Alexandrium_andersonii.AAC.1
MGSNVPPIPGQDEERQRYLPWRQSPTPAFVESSKLYVGFHRGETQEYVRVLLDMAMEFNLLLNGGGRNEAL